MKNKYLIPVPGADVSLFARMIRDYISEEEKVFFERLSYDEASVPTICGQMYIHEDGSKDRTSTASSLQRKQTHSPTPLPKSKKSTTSSMTSMV